MINTKKRIKVKIFVFRGKGNYFQRIKGDFVIEMAFDHVLEKLVKSGKYQIFGNH